MGVMNPSLGYLKYLELLVIFCIAMASVPTARVPVSFVGRLRRRRFIQFPMGLLPLRLLGWCRLLLPLLFCHRDGPFGGLSLKRELMIGLLSWCRCVYQIVTGLYALSQTKQSFIRAVNGATERCQRGWWSMSEAWRMEPDGGTENSNHILGNYALFSVFIGERWKYRTRTNANRNSERRWSWTIVKKMIIDMF